MFPNYLPNKSMRIIKMAMSVVKKFLQQEETDHLYEVALQDDAMRKNALDLNDQSGKKTRFPSGLRRAMMYLVISPVAKK